MGTGDISHYLATLQQKYAKYLRQEESTVVVAAAARSKQDARSAAKSQLPFASLPRSQAGSSQLGLNTPLGRMLTGTTPSEVTEEDQDMADNDNAGRTSPPITAPFFTETSQRSFQWGTTHGSEESTRAREQPSLVPMMPLVVGGTSKGEASSHKRLLFDEEDFLEAAPQAAKEHRSDFEHERDSIFFTPIEDEDE